VVFFSASSAEFVLHFPAFLGNRANVLQNPAHFCAVL
jgi:hypothetical protein